MIFRSANRSGRHFRLTAGVGRFGIRRRVRRGRRFRRRRLRRLHRKLAVIDGLIAFVGGINIVDDWNDLDRRGQQPPRFDYAVKVQGSVVEMVHVSTHKLWQLVHWSRHGRRSLPRPIRHVPAAGAMDCAFVIRDNLRHRRDIEEAYLDAIANARQEIVLANAYFIPGRRFRQALIDAARRGVRVVASAVDDVASVDQHVLDALGVARLDRALRLLRDHHMRPSEAASEAGYADQAHMTHALRDFGGLSPARLADVTLVTLGD